LIPDLDAVMAPDGWTYASSRPVDADDPGRFNALFGRDSLITALQLLPERPGIARATLRAHAALQSKRIDPDTDEEPGKIVHEYRPHAEQRFVDLGWPVRDGTLAYYGSADGTSWFLVVLAALGDEELTRELDGGLVRHGPRRSSGGLVQQGWRDTQDPHSAYGGGILNADGSVPEPPLADADTQAVAVAALRAAAVLVGEQRWSELADRTSALIAERFTPDTMALDGEDTRVEGAGSQLGWLLWGDALPEHARPAYAERLSQPDVLTHWGLRTLSSDHPQFAPEAYHRGAVWPFDSWLGWAGLRAAGAHDAAEHVRGGVLEALERLGGAPELYAATPSGPQRIPIANKIQAWTVGARFALEREWDGRPVRL
jgi:glycogen debranching enzyme